MNSIDIDVGGTFTDLVLNYMGKSLIRKSPTTPYDLSVCFTRVIEQGAIYLRIISWNFVATGLIFTCSGLFQALGNTWPSLLSSASRLLTFVVPVVLLVMLLALTLRNTGIRNPGDPRKLKTVKEENHLATVRSTLAKQTDLSTCKAVIGQLNAHLQNDPDYAPPALPRKSKEDLRKQLAKHP